MLLSSYDDMRTTLNTPRDLALLVRSLREERRVSQTELALRADVSRSWLSQFERGKATAELGLVLRLLDALDLDLVAAERTGPDDAATDLDTLLGDLGR